MKNIYRIISFSLAFLFLAIAVSLENINSMFIDFQQIPSNQLPMFQFAFFGLFVAFMLATVYIGEDY